MSEAFGGDKNNVVKADETKKGTKPKNNNNAFRQKCCLLHGNNKTHFDLLFKLANSFSL